MAKYLLHRQHMAPVPISDDPDKKIASQHLLVTADPSGAAEVVFDDEVAFDPTTGAEPAEDQLPKFWLAEGEEVRAEVTYTRESDNATSTFVEEWTVEDQFTGEVPVPPDLGVTDQIDEQESDTRPTV